MIQRFPLPALLFLLTAITANSQIPFFQHYYLLKKNEPVHVNDVFQDDSGFIWYGTNKGLFRFDGRNYLRFTKADSLPDEDVTAVGQDSLGRIWTGYSNGHLAYFEKGMLHHFDPPEGSAAAPVSDILFDKRGILWFSTLNDGLYYYRGNRLFRLDDLEGMPDLFVYDLSEDSDGSIWAGTDGGIVVCKLGGDDVSLDVLDHDDGLPDNIVRKLAHLADGRVLIGTDDAGVVTLDPDRTVFTSLFDKWNAGSVVDFSIRNANLWIATSRGGLLYYDIELSNLAMYERQPGYSIPSITTLFTDREGNLWAGTKTDVIRSAAGLEFIEPGQGVDPNVLALAIDNSNALWFSTGDGLFRRTVDETGHVTLTRLLQHTPYERYTVISLYNDDSGFLWAGLYGEGVLRIDPRTLSVVYISRELRNGNVLAITGGQNEIWLATLGGAECITLSGNNYDIRHYNRENGLSSDFIYQVFVDSRKRVWFATDGKGVDMLDGSGLHHFEEGLPTKVAYGFAEDSLKQIWVNVQGNGIYKFVDGTFTPLESFARLRSNDITSLASDRNGNILAGHDFGIDVINSQGKLIRYFGEEAGIRDMQPTLNAVSRDQFGDLYFGTSRGIIRFAMKSSVFRQRPDVYIDQLRVFDRPWNLDETPRMSYDENSITVTFHGFWYQNPAGLQYRYKLENFDEDWIATANNAVTYSRLPAGEYAFKIKSSDNEDFSDAREATLKFTITPPFWKTTPFYFILVAVAMAGGYSFIKYRERQLKLDNLILERKVEERTLEIQKKTEEIQAQNEEIMAQAEEIKGINENLEMLVKQRTDELQKKNAALEEYAFINAHKLRGPLASILGLINLIEKTDLDAEAREIHRRLQQSADELDDIVRTITQAIERGER